MVQRIRLAVRCLLVAGAIIVAAPGAAGAQQSTFDIVAPQLECVTVNGDGTYTALFGTENYWSIGVWMPHGSLNRVTPRPVAADPLPEWILPGRQVGVFTVTQEVGNPINYKLGVTSVQATSDSTPCNAAPQVAEAPFVVGLLGVAGALTALGYRRLSVAPA